MQIQRIKDVAKFYNGYAFKSKNYTDGGEYIVRIGDIKQRGIDLSNAKRVDILKEKKDLSNYQIKQNSILLAMSGATTGKVSLYNLNQKAYLNQRVGMLVCENNILPKYLYYFLSNYSDKFLSSAIGAAIQNLSKFQIENTEIPLPSLQEQEKIVERLDELERISIELFETYKKQLFDLKILYEGFLNGLFSQLNKNITPLQLSTINITDGSHNPTKGIDESDYMMLSSKNVIDDSLNFDNPRYLTKEDFILENKRTNLEINDVLLTIVGTIGRTAVIKSLEHNITFQRSVCVIKPNKEILDPHYLKYFLDSIKGFLEKNARGVAQKGIYLKQVRAINIPLMDLDRQMQLVSKIEKVNNLVKEITKKKKEQTLKQEHLKKSILQKEFSYE